MMRRIRHLTAAALVVVLASCGSVEPDVESGWSPYPPPDVPVPAEWGPMPLSTVWSAAPGIDLDSRPVQIARAFVDGVIYIDSGVGMDEGYEGFTEFSGISHNSQIPESNPPVTGTFYNYVYDITHEPGVDGTNYSVTVCKSGSKTREWMVTLNEWVKLTTSVYKLNFSLPGGPVETHGGDPINMVDRIQHPSWNVFGGATNLNESGRLGYVGMREGRALIEEECVNHIPPRPESRLAEGPIEPGPWFPGWPGRMD